MPYEQNSTAMNISYNWLKRYIETDLPAERIAEILTKSEAKRS